MKNAAKRLRGKPRTFSPDESGASIPSLAVTKADFETRPRSSTFIVGEVKSSKSVPVSRNGSSGGLYPVPEDDALSRFLFLQVLSLAVFGMSADSSSFTICLSLPLLPCPWPAVLRPVQKTSIWPSKYLMPSLRWTPTRSANPLSTVGIVPNVHP